VIGVKKAQQWLNGVKFASQRNGNFA